MPPAKKNQLQFEIDAAVVYELGEKLISDEVQSLVELVKNSYDADASYSSVMVDSEKLVSENSSSFPNAEGYIIIEDDGTGMDLDDILNGWLTISASPKRKMKAQGKTTKKGRTPLGDKGLGRLGSQRLGQNIEIWTSKEGSDIEYYVGIDWGDFRDKILSTVPVHFYERQLKKTRKGTRIVVSGLRNSNKWKGKGRDELIRKISQLLFPFEELRHFDVFLTVNGVRIDLDNVPKRVFDVANAKYSFSFDGKLLQIHGKYRLSFLMPTTKGEHARQQFQRLIELDQGADYYTFLTDRRTKTASKFKWEDESGWFVSFKDQYKLGDLGDVELGDTTLLENSTNDIDSKEKIANPGPFRGYVFSFTRKGTNLSTISDIFSLESEFSRYVQRHSGIRVFRDGFGIRPFGIDGNDWLQLGSGWTSAISYYALRPANVIGYVDLTAKDNNKLEEATDREGFVENGYSRNFHLLMRKFVETITIANTNLRRGYNEYVKQRVEQEAGFTSQESSDLFTTMRETASTSKNLENQVTNTRDNLESVHRKVEALTLEIESTPLFMSGSGREFEPVLKIITNTLDEATSILNRIEALLFKAKQLGDVADILEPDLEHLREELEVFSELAGLGITAEALTHEMSIIADSLAARTSDLLKKLKKRKSPDQELITYTEHVHTAVGRIRKQLSHLDPSMRYVREQREKIHMRPFFSGIRDFYFERFTRNRLEISIDEPFDDFIILMNRGKLTQVVDNLLLNSEYWLKEDLRKGEISKSTVFLRSKKPRIEIYDTGRGVSTSVENYLFQPFVTTKPRGRGLGLFIARQLLDSSGCFISLLPDRNLFDRRYIFRIDLTGAIVND